MKPVIVINLKTYKQGKNVVKLAKEIEKVNKNIIIGVQVSDAEEVAKKTKLKVFVQHVDYFKPGRETGYIIPEAVKADGAVGTFLNHSEHPLKIDIIKKTIARCKKLKLRTIIFAKNIKEAKKIEKLNPNYLIYEPPELVAGNVSVSKAKPKIIKKFAKKIKMKFIVGAGIHSNKDLKVAMQLGASGIAVSSVITTAKNPKKALRELIK